MQALVLDEFVKANIIEEGNACGRTDCNTMPAQMDRDLYVKFLISGPLTELYYRTIILNEKLELKDVWSDDYSNARKKFRSFIVDGTFFIYDQEFFEYLKPLEREVTVLLEENWSNIVSIAKVLLEMKYANRQQIDSLGNIVKDAVEVRAYRIWEGAGRGHDNDWDHWFRAKEKLGLPPDRHI